MSSIFSINDLLEALLSGSARDGFFRPFYRLVPRAALAGYLGPGDGRGPLPKAALNALHTGVFDPAITHRDAFVCHCPRRRVARPGFLILVTALALGTPGLKKSEGQSERAHLLHLPIPEGGN